MKASNEWYNLPATTIEKSQGVSAGASPIEFELQSGKGAYIKLAGIAAAKQGSCEISTDIPTGKLFKILGYIQPEEDETIASYSCGVLFELDGKTAEELTLSLFFKILPLEEDGEEVKVPITITTTAAAENWVSNFILTCF